MGRLKARALARQPHHCHLVDSRVNWSTLGTHSFKPRSKAAQLSAEQRRALIFSRPNLGTFSGGTESVLPRCPAPREKPGPHPPPGNDPPFVGSPPKGHSPPVAGWHPYPLLVAQALSIVPESKLRPAVDCWLSHEDDRLVRRPAPLTPWDVAWGPEHVSVVIPPRGYEAAALEKMIADGARGIIFLPHDVDSKTLSRATGHAATIIALEGHPDARSAPARRNPSSHVGVPSAPW